MDGNPGMSEPPTPPPPADFNIERYMSERTPVDCPFVYDHDFNNSMRLVFAREIKANVSEGTKDRQPHNMERVRVLIDRQVSLPRVATAENQSPNFPLLIRDARGYVDKTGKGKDFFIYNPNADKIVEPTYAHPCRGIVNITQNKLRANTLTTHYTYVSLEMGHMIVCTSTPDGYMRTYWKHRSTLAYLATTVQKWKELMTNTLQEIALWARARISVPLLFVNVII